VGINWPKSGANHANAFQMPGVPFVISTAVNDIPARDLQDKSSGGGSDRRPIKFEFPFVTKWITIRNIGKNNLRIGFSEEGIMSKNDFYSLSDVNAVDGEQKQHNTLNFYLLHTSGSEHSTNGFHHPTTNRMGGDTAIDDSITLNVRCTEIFLVSDSARNNPGNTHATGVSIMAGLTTIPRDQFPTLTGSILGNLAFEGV